MNDRHRIPPEVSARLAKLVKRFGGEVRVVRCVFFFSSRRRHTRLTCDWSSDVCSSDLAGVERRRGAGLVGLLVALERSIGHAVRERLRPAVAVSLDLDVELRRQRVDDRDRSEERRVGKECRDRWAPDQYKKKKLRRVYA